MVKAFAALDQRSIDRNSLVSDLRCGGVSDYRAEARPSLRIVCASYSHEQAAKHARDFRTILEMPCRATSEMKRAAVSEWYDSTLVSRLDNKNKDAIVLIMRRRQVD